MEEFLKTEEAPDCPVCIARHCLIILKCTQGTPACYRHNLMRETKQNQKNLHIKKNLDGLASRVKKRRSQSVNTDTYITDRYSDTVKELQNIKTVQDNNNKQFEEMFNLYKSSITPSSFNCSFNSGNNNVPVNANSNMSKGPKNNMAEDPIIPEHIINTIIENANKDARAQCDKDYLKMCEDFENVNVGKVKDLTAQIKAMDDHIKQTEAQLTQTKAEIDQSNNSLAQSNDAINIILEALAFSHPTTWKNLYTRITDLSAHKPYLKILLGHMTKYQKNCR